MPSKTASDYGKRPAGCNRRNGQKKRLKRLAGSQSISRRLAKTPSTKPQAPEKFQISKTKPQKDAGAKGEGRFLSLELGASLEFGVWILELAVVSSPGGFMAASSAPSPHLP